MKGHIELHAINIKHRLLQSKATMSFVSEKSKEQQTRGEERCRKRKEGSKRKVEEGEKKRGKERRGSEGGV